MVIDYKRWVIEKRIEKLKKYLRDEAFSYETEKRKQELGWLELELKDLDESR